MQWNSLDSPCCHGIRCLPPADVYLAHQCHPPELHSDLSIAHIFHVAPAPAHVSSPARMKISHFFVLLAKFPQCPQFRSMTSGARLLGNFPLGGYSPTRAWSKFLPLSACV